jgi:hypothetical protein
VYIFCDVSEDAPEFDENRSMAALPNLLLDEG